MGWFLGLKPHLVINNQGQIMELRIPTANVHDRHPWRPAVNAARGVAVSIPYEPLSINSRR